MILRRVKARASRSNRFRRYSAPGLHASRDSLYRTVIDERQCRAVIPLEVLPRRCPTVWGQTIVATDGGFARPTITCTSACGCARDLSCVSTTFTVLQLAGAFRALQRALPTTGL